MEACPMCWGARLGGSSAAVDVYVLDSMKGSEALALSLCAAEELCGGDPSAVSGQARIIADLYDLVLEDLASRSMSALEEHCKEFHLRFSHYIYPCEKINNGIIPLLDERQLLELVMPLLDCKGVRAAQLLGLDLTPRRCPHGLSQRLREQLVVGSVQLLKYSDVSWDCKQSVLVIVEHLMDELDLENKEAVQKLYAKLGLRFGMIESLLALLESLTDDVCDPDHLRQALYILAASLRGVKKSVTADAPRITVGSILQRHPGFLKLLQELIDEGLASRLAADDWMHGAILHLATVISSTLTAIHPAVAASLRRAGFETKTLEWLVQCHPRYADFDIPFMSMLADMQAATGPCEACDHFYTNSSGSSSGGSANNGQGQQPAPQMPPQTPDQQQQQQRTRAEGELQSDDPGEWRVGQLKAFLVQAGVQSGHCIEKPQLVELAREVLGAAPPPPPPGASAAGLRRSGGLGPSTSGHVASSRASTGKKCAACAAGSRMVAASCECALAAELCTIAAVSVSAAIGRRIRRLASG